MQGCRSLSNLSEWPTNSGSMWRGWVGFEWLFHWEVWQLGHGSRGVSSQPWRVCMPEYYCQIPNSSISPSSSEPPHISVSVCMFYLNIVFPSHLHNREWVTQILNLTLVFWKPNQGHASTLKAGRLVRGNDRASPKGKWSIKVTPGFLGVYIWGTIIVSLKGAEDILFEGIHLVVVYLLSTVWLKALKHPW